MCLSDITLCSLTDSYPRISNPATGAVLSTAGPSVEKPIIQPLSMEPLLSGPSHHALTPPSPSVHANISHQLLHLDATALQPVHAKPTSKVGIQVSALMRPIRNLIHELGLNDHLFLTLGHPWKDFCEAWVTAEIALQKLGGSLPSPVSHRLAPIPHPLMQWYAKHHGAIEEPDWAGIGSSMQTWWGQLNAGGDLFAERLVGADWCVAGTSGILLLVLGMQKWGVSVCGDKDMLAWNAMLEEMKVVFDRIPSADNL